MKVTTRRLFVICLGCGLLAAVSLSAQTTADDLVAKYFQALGGRDSIASIRTLKLTGDSELPGSKGEFELYQKAPDKIFRISRMSEGKAGIGSDGKVAWRVTPMGNTGTEGRMRNRILRQGLINPLLDYKSRGAKLVALGPAKLDDSIPCNVLELIEPDNDSTRMYFRTSDNLLVCSSVGMVDNYFADFRKVQGRVFPFLITTKSKGQMRQKYTVKSLTVNSPLNDSLFVPPPLGDLKPARRP